MSTPLEIKTAAERNSRALELRPGIGQGTARTNVRMVDGLTCTVEDGPWTLTVDMSPKHGGDDAGPNPGVLGRGALGSCLVISYMTWAARLDIPIGALEVMVEADYDSNGSYGTTDVEPGYSEIRFVVTVESDASEAQVLELLEKAKRHTPYLDVFNRAQTVKRELRLTSARS